MKKAKSYGKPKRPVFIADYRAKVVSLTPGGKESGMTTHVEVNEPTSAKCGARKGLRYRFPKAGSVAEGGESDGYCYRIEFAAGRYVATYALLRSFLVEQGYGEVPVPTDVKELMAFRLPRKLRHQLSLFGDDGYVHNPLKILFPKPAGRRGALILELYDEAAPGHLLRFHRRHP